MNLPNKLTILRIMMAPVFLALLLIPFPHHYLAALLVFIAASLTDLIDGKIARKYNMITDFGKFMDPLADKMLTTAAFLGFIQLGLGWGVTWITMIVLTREFLVTSLRLSAAGSGKVIAANIWGKAKTVSQMSGIILTLAAEYVLSFDALSAGAASLLRGVYSAVLVLSGLLTVVSGAIYMVDNAKFVDTKK